MFADVLKKLRSEKGISQSELAEKLNVVQQTVAKWETSVAAPGVAIMKSIALYFNVTTDYLLEMPGAAFHGSTITPDEYELISAYRFLDEWGRSSIRNTLNHELQRCAALPGAKKKRSAM